MGELGACVEALAVRRVGAASVGESVPTLKRNLTTLDPQDSLKLTTTVVASLNELLGKAHLAEKRFGSHRRGAATEKADDRATNTGSEGANDEDPGGFSD